MSKVPKNSAEVAIRLIDKAHEMNIPVKIEVSLVTHSDSRYVILFPNTEAEAMIRISSHAPPPYKHYALLIDVSRPSMLASATERGTAWMEETYGDGKTQALAERGGLAPAPVSNRRQRGHGHSISGRRGHPIGEDASDTDRFRRRLPRRLRNSGPLSERPRGEGKRICVELPGDD